MNLESHLKLYLAIAATIASLYAGWQVFEKYNADGLELALVQKEIVNVSKDVAEINISVRRDAAAKILEMNARARAHYSELQEEGDLRPAEVRRLNYLNEAVPDQQAEVEKLEERLEDLEATE